MYTHVGSIVGEVLIEFKGFHPRISNIWGKAQCSKCSSVGIRCEMHSQLGGSVHVLPQEVF